MLAKTDIALITHVFLFVKLWPSVESWTECISSTTNDIILHDRHILWCRTVSEYLWYLYNFLTGSTTVYSLWLWHWISSRSTLGLVAWICSRGQCFKGSKVTQGDLGTPRQQGVAVAQGELGPPGCLCLAFRTMLVVMWDIVYGFSNYSLLL